MSEPLTDFSARTLCLGRDVTNTVDGLLRLQNTRDRKKPITLYVPGITTTAPLSLMDSIAICSVMRTLQSPVVTIGFGHLKYTQPIIVAAGTGKRWLLKHTIVQLAPLQWHGLTQLNLGFGGTCQQKNIFETQFESLLEELKLNPSLFNADQLFNAQQAIENKMADGIIHDTTRSENKMAYYERR